MYWYKFKVKYWEDNTPFMGYGITFGSTYANAISNISKDYGEHNIEEIDIISMDSGETCPITRGTFLVIDEPVPTYEINEEVKDNGEESV